MEIMAISLSSVQVSIASGTAVRNCAHVGGYLEISNPRMGTLLEPLDYEQEGPRFALDLYPESHVLSRCVF